MRQSPHVLRTSVARRYTIGALAFVAAIAASGCGKKSAGPSAVPESKAAAPSGPSSAAYSGAAYGAIPGVRNTWGIDVMKQPGTVVQLEYRDDVAKIDMQTVGQALRGVSEDHHIFLFQDSPALREKFQPGKIVLFQGLDLRKIDAVAVDGQNLVVGTEKAPLNQALKNAKVQWRVPVDFGQIFDQLAARLNPKPPDTSRFVVLNSLSSVWDAIQPTVHADVTNSEFEGEVEVNDSDFAAWKVHYHITREPGTSAGLTGRGIDFDIQLTRGANGLDAQIHAKGTVSKFDQVASVLMENGNFQHVSFKNVGMHGNATFDWSISTSEGKTPMNEVRLKLPGKIEIPLIEVTDLPMSLQISEALLFHPAFTTKGEVAKGSFSVNYSGDEGFTLQGSDMETDGQADGNSTIDSAVAFSPLASFGLVVAMAVPRVELRMGTEELFEMAHIPIPQSLAESLTDALMKNTIAGQWLNNKTGNPLSAEAAAYFQLVLSTTAAHSGMQSLVPCQQFTMNARGQVGVDAEWLGNNVGTQAKDLFVKNLTKRDPDAKICGGG